MPREADPSGERRKDAVGAGGRGERKQENAEERRQRVGLRTLHVRPLRRKVTLSQ